MTYEESPATWWPRWRLEPVIDPQLPPASQYKLLGALSGEAAPGRRGRRARELAAAMRASYVWPNSDLDDSARPVYWRVMDAIDAAREAADSDAVDGIEARIVLSAERWGIASELAAQTQLRQANTASGIARDRDLARAVRATTKRASAVVTYVQQLTLLAQAAHRGEQGAALANQRLDALAATEADTLATNQLREMTARARELIPAPAEQAQVSVTRLLARAARHLKSFRDQLTG